MYCTKAANRYPYTATQIFLRLGEGGYTGGLTIVKDYVRHVRPPQTPAFLTLAFAPGECAQVDWGQFGSINVGNTRRRLSFFVMVLCYSRMLYVQFTLSETMEHFLACHAAAFTFFGGVPAKCMVDNLKSAVLRRVVGEAPVLNRGAFYETAGCLRDVIQNHLFQVVALLAMEPPAGRDYGAVHNEKAKVFQAMRPLTPGDLVRGQYAGYRKEPDVAKKSDVETYCALRLFIDSWRWEGVPWYLRSGKYLAETATEVLVELKPPPQRLFADSAAETNGTSPSHK